MTNKAQSALAPTETRSFAEVQKSMEADLNEQELASSRILVLDDEESTTDIIGTHLEYAGFSAVSKCTSPAAAIEHLQYHPHDLLILDIRMPEIDGMRILKFLRNKPETRYMPIIVLTNAQDQTTRLEALNAGASDFLNKPVDVEELVARVRNALSFKRYADRIEHCADLVKRELDRDALTQLQSRRAFDNYLANEFAHGRTSDLSLILFDIDKFKHTNDEYGHRAGDLILQKIGAIVDSRCGDNEFASRIGGDEFAILCHHPNAEATAVFAERLRQSISDFSMTYKSRTIKSTVSVGIARFSPSVRSSEMLFDMADSALYYSKRSGRNTTSIHSEVEAELNEEQRDRSLLERRASLEQLDPKDGRILVIDDEPVVTSMLSSQLTEAGYQNIEAENNALAALDRIKIYRPDLVILDIRMPGINGLEILRKLREGDEISSVPVLIMTSSNDDRIRMAALKLQANDFLTKPANAAELAARVHNSLLMKFQHDQLKEISARLRFEVEVRTQELYATRREAILCLARTAESRDDETGKHVLRVGRYAGIIGRSLGLEDNFVSWLELAAQLHDVGKIAIPDSVLYKPGKLTPEEFEIMKTHCQEADRIFGGDEEAGYKACTSPLLQMAGRIALTHHERWDGTGYPNGLAGNDIPVEGRITTVADVFDAISSRRHYKDAFSIDECFRLLEEGIGTHFDPEVVQAFFRAKDDILQSMTELQDTPLAKGQKQVATPKRQLASTD